MLGNKAETAAMENERDEWEAAAKEFEQAQDEFKHADGIFCAAKRRLDQAKMRMHSMFQKRMRAAGNGV